MTTNIDEMEMPCRCDCGNWFDLHEGYQKRDSDKVICEACHEQQEKDIEREEEIRDLKETIENAKVTIEDAQEEILTASKRLRELGEWMPEPPIVIP